MRHDAGRRRLRRTMLAALAGLVLGCGGSRVERESSVASLPPDTLQAWMVSGVEMRVFDVRSREAYDRGHVPGAVPAEDRTVSQLREVLPYQRDAPIVVYNLDGRVDPGRYDLAAEAADTFGFPRVYWLEGGLAGWRAAGYDVDGRIDAPE